MPAPISDHPFWQYLGTHSDACDSFLALLQAEVLQENRLDCINEKNTLDYQRGKVAVLRHLESLAQRAAHKREKEQ